MPNQSKPGPWPDDGLVAEAAYLVARGVRPMALVYDGMADGPTMLELASRLEAIGDPGAIPMVVDHGDGRTGAGYAVAGWVIDLYEWVTSVDGRVAVPERHRHAILGLLLGYGSAAISRHQDGLEGRRFRPLTQLEPVSK